MDNDSLYANQNYEKIISKYKKIANNIFHKPTVKLTISIFNTDTQTETKICETGRNCFERYKINYDPSQQHFNPEEEAFYVINLEELEIVLKYFVSHSEDYMINLKNDALE